VTTACSLFYNTQGGRTAALAIAIKQ
jgi:hypothetical protein